MTTTSLNRSRDDAEVTLRSVPTFLGRIANGVANYLARARAERELESLDDRLLSDIGVSRSDIRAMVWGKDRIV